MAVSISNKRRMPTVSPHSSIPDGTGNEEGENTKAVESPVADDGGDTVALEAVLVLGPERKPATDAAPADATERTLLSDCDAAWRKESRYRLLGRVLVLPWRASAASSGSDVPSPPNAEAEARAAELISAKGLNGPECRVEVGAGVGDGRGIGGGELMRPPVAPVPAAIEARAVVATALDPLSKVFPN